MTTKKITATTRPSIDLVEIGTTVEVVDDAGLYRGTWRSTANWVGERYWIREQAPALASASPDADVPYAHLDDGYSRDSDLDDDR